MSNEVIGSGLTKGAVEQIKAREELISQDVKTREHLMFFNQNGAWARMLSSVDTLTEKQALDLLAGITNVGDVNGDNTLAQTNILTGGVLGHSSGQNRYTGGVSQEKYHNPASVDSYGFVTPGDQKTNAYHNYKSIGFRPTPGITSVEVTSRGTYGTLREAKVEFKVWTLEDLEVMQALYLRPGYSVFLEWGHSLQLNTEDRKVRKEIPRQLNFLLQNMEDPMGMVERISEKLRQDSDYNYDSFVGYISNFNWSLNQEGGYDCSVKIIAKGSVLESIRATFDPSNVYPADQFREPQEGAIHEEKKSIFHKFFYEITNLKNLSVNKAVYSKNDLPGATIRIELETDYGIIDTVARYRTAEHFKETLNDFIAVKTEKLKDGINEFWIPLYALLDVFNNFVSIRDNTTQRNKGTNSNGRKLIQFYTGHQDSNKQRGAKYEKTTKYLTSDYHFSINPLVCVLPKAPVAVKLYDSAGSIIRWPNKQDSYPMGRITNNDFHDKLSALYQNKLVKGETDDILNILLSVEFLKEEFDKIVQEDEDSDQNENNNMVTVMSSILKAMNEALGGVNDLDLHYDDQDDMYYVVDRKVTPAPGNNDPDRLPTLALSGKKSSTMTDVQISSQISNKIGSMVAIAAQGSGGNSRDNIATLLQWNNGLIDRHIRHKTDKGDDTDTEEQKKHDEKEDERLKQWIKEYYNYWDKFNTPASWTNLWTKPKFDADVVPSLSGYHKVFCQRYVVEKYYKPETGQGLPPPGTIPVELSFSTIGIGGLKIGQAFRIERGLLPERYATDFGYIITGLSHTIQDNKWTTNVKTQFYSIKPPSTEEVQAYNRRYKTSTSPANSMLQSPLIFLADAQGEDPAPTINLNREGQFDATNTPVYKSYGGALDLRGKDLDYVEKLINNGTLAKIGNTGDPGFSATGDVTAILLDGKYYLEKSAATAFNKWAQEMRDSRIQFVVSSAIRFGGSTGAGPHGYGIAVDFANLHQLVGGSQDPTVNKNARIKFPIYKQIAEIGAKYKWYNPWRLSKSLTGKNPTTGKDYMDEIWHFEYWGNP